MVVVDAPTAPGVPVLRDQERGVGFAVGQLVVEVGVVSGGVQKTGFVNNPCGWLRDFHLEVGSRGHRCPILVEDSPLPGHGRIPDTDVVIVGGSPRVALTGGKRDKHGGVRPPVYARVADNGVIPLLFSSVARCTNETSRFVPGLSE